MADYGFIANAPQTSPMSSVKDILGFAQGAQNLQLQRQSLQSGAQGIEKQDIELQKQRQGNQERVATQSFMQDPKNWQDDSGKIDMGKINAELPKIAPMTHADTIQKLSTLSEAQTKANEAKLKLSGDRRAIIANLYGVLGRSGVQDPKAVLSEMENLKTQFPDDKDMAQYIDNAKTGLSMIPGGPDLPKHLVTASQSLLTPSEQQAALSQKAGFLKTGGENLPTIETPAVGGNPPNIAVATPGTGVTETLPPTTQRYNPVTQQMEFLGNAPPDRAALAGKPADVLKSLQSIEDPEEQKRAIAAYGRQLDEVAAGRPPVTGTPVPAGAPLGVKEAVGGTVETMNKDWESTQSAAKTAASDVGLLQNIKKFAIGAVTGVESDKRAYVAGLAGLIGMKPEELQKTNTDLLAKNTNMLALAGGDTNLARVMAEGANPNTHMTKEAISDAANQIIAQRKFSLERQRILQPIKASIDRGLTAPAEYNAMLAKINKIDPRVLQLPEMSKEEKIRMMKAMSPKEQDSFIQMTREAHALGMGR